MAGLPFNKGAESITQDEHISPAKTGDNIAAKRIAAYGWDGTDWQRKTINSEGRDNVVQHAHPYSGTVFFSTGSLAATTDFIVVDVSNTTDYPHNLTNYVHLEDLVFQTDADGSASYVVQLGFLENVDATNGDFYTVGGVNGSKSTGQSRFEVIPIYPNGARCTTQFVATSNKSLNDTAFQTDVNLKSTIDPTNATVPSGSGDLVLRVTVLAGSVIVSGSIAYHTH